jgi:hypothetical protein
MTNEEGEKLLLSQRDKISSLNSQSYITWQSQTAWVFEQLFTKDSDLYKRINQFSFYSHYSDTPTNQQIKNNSAEAVHLLDSAIEMVKYIPIPKPPQKVNIIYRIKDNWLIFWTSTIVAAYGGVFYLGTLYGKYEERLSNSISTNANQIPKKDTTGINKKDSNNYNAQMDSLKNE